MFCYSYGSFLNDVKLGIVILITNMALKIQNDAIIRKTIKKQTKKRTKALKGCWGRGFRGGEMFHFSFIASFSK